MFHKVSEHNIGKLLGHIKAMEKGDIRPDMHVLRENKQGC